MGHVRIVGNDDSKAASVTSMGALAVDTAGSLADPNNILSGTVTVTNSTSPGTIITIPAGRQWVGDVSVSLASTGAAIVAASVSVVGTNSVPATGTVVARVNVGGLTSGGFQDSLTCRVRAVAPTGNSISLWLTNSSATTNTSSAAANGVLI